MYNRPMKYLIIALILIAAAYLAVSYTEYRRNFYVRYSEPTGFTEFYLGKNPELKHRDFSCLSSKGTRLRGILLIPQDDPRALIVMVHGYNLSSENYLALAHRFVKSGYQVLLFDGTGVGMSEGKGIYGLPQHIPDLKSVLDEVCSDPDLKALPLLLFGHSWGGYAACTIPAVENYPLKGILACSAFFNSSSSKAPTIRRRYPLLAPMYIGSAEFLERQLFGPVASLTAPDGLAKASCPVMLIHSEDDHVVPYDDAFLKIKNSLSSHENISFISVKGRGHNLFLDPENDRRQREIRKMPDVPGLEAELRDLMSETDPEMADRFTAFFNSCLLS